MPLPRDPAFDATAAFWREGYTFIGRRCDRLRSDAFRTRLMLRPVICWRGAEAAALFYDAERVTRRGAMPKSVQHLLQDEGSVQALDDAAHRLRKALFLDMMQRDSLERLTTLFADAWRDALPAWRLRGRIRFHDALRDLLTGVACAWVGVPLDAEDLPRRRAEMAAMIDRAGTVGPANWGARLLRRRAERWAAEVYQEAKPAPETPLARLQAHREGDGAPLPPEVAAVEILNLIRPTVAVARFLTFAALALHQQPHWRERFAEGHDADLEPFVQEVRRTAPFFPVVGGRTRRAFEWDGHFYGTGDWLLLDLYGTNHDPRLWHEPQAFRPERFRDWSGDAHTFVPQGAGALDSGHRCPGEWATIALMGEGLRLLSRETAWSVPPQDLSVALNRIPALPQSGLIISIG